MVGSAVPGIVLGGLLGIVRKPGPRLTPGITFASKFVLQLSVVILGLQLSIGEVARVGLESLPVMLGTLVVCLGAAWLFGRLLGVIGDVRTLIGVGTGICGASAVAAVAPVIGAVSADVAYAVSTIFLFNVAAGWRVGPVRATSAARPMLIGMIISVRTSLTTTASFAASEP